ncbi:MAG: hypothetical protein PHC86_06340 [Eubacteriales bacterium]|nr:hypothetical protein [Eubacteriales bacterium]
MSIVTHLLNAAEPWVAFRALQDLAGYELTSPAVQTIRQNLLAHPLVTGLIDEMQDWPGTVLNSHKSAGQQYHKLAFLADLGLTREDADFSILSAALERSQSLDGIFRLPMLISQAHGGSGQLDYAWALCDAPLLLYSALKMNLVRDRQLAIRAVETLAAMVRDNGWPCVVSPELGGFRGPGKKADPCPYASLIMLKLLALTPAGRISPAAHAGVETLLRLWAESQNQHPYMFFMGTDFRKLKAPFIWYDIVHVVDVLSQFPIARTDPRLQDMLAIMTGKADADGWYTPESVWQAWGAWDFGQKKQHSPWLTFCIERIKKRIQQTQGGLSTCL